MFVLSYEIIFQVVTVSEKKRVLDDCHSQGRKHLDTDKTLAKVSERYYWPRVKVDVEGFCQSCEQCQATNRLAILPLYVSCRILHFSIKLWLILYSSLLMNAGVLGQAYLMFCCLS